jgi:Gpi18-like mannosyltransferase
MFSLAFAFKLQAMFLIPALIICLFVGNIKLRHLIFFPLVNILAVVPTVISGRNFFEVLTIYFRQTQSYPSLDMNAPSIFRFVFNVNFDWFNMLGIMLGGFGVLCLLYFAFRKRDKIDDRALVTFFYLSAIAVPYLLPRMHERYFFVADVLSFILFLVARKLWYVPLINIFASFVAYAYYLFYGVTLINYIYVAFALLVIIILVIKDLYKYLSTSSSVGKEGQNG